MKKIKIKEEMHPLVVQFHQRHKMLTKSSDLYLVGHKQINLINGLKIKCDTKSSSIFIT